MKYAREIKVAVLAIVCIFLLFFGMHFLKGVNIFSAENQYIGIFANVDGLTEQAPVFVRGYKVGQVDCIAYDFSRPDAFTITLSVHKNIRLTANSEIHLVDNGLMGGKALEVVIPTTDDANGPFFAEGDTLPTRIVPGLMASVQEGLLQKLDDAMLTIDSLVNKINAQISDNTLKNTLDNVEQVTFDLSASAHDIKKVTSQQLPTIMQNADTLLADAKLVVRDVKDANLSATVARVDQTIDTIQGILTTKQGTLGLLLNDKNLYQHVDSTVVSVDSLINDLKKNPKRYVHFSLFGGKDKAKKADKKQQ